MRNSEVTKLRTHDALTKASPDIFTQCMLNLIVGIRLNARFGICGSINCCQKQLKLNYKTSNRTLSLSLSPAPSTQLKYFDALQQKPYRLQNR